MFNAKESLKDVAASVVGAVACCYTGQPFDTVKVRLQARPDEYTGMMQTFYKTAEAEGVAALWKGSVAVVTGMIMENAAAFGVNEQLKRVFPQSAQDLDGGAQGLFQPFMLGALTGSLVSFALCPSEIVKTRTQLEVANAKTSGLKAPTSMDILKKVWRLQGMAGLYTGIDAQIARDGLFYAVFFGSYEILVRAFRKHTSLPDEANFFISGGLAGMLGWGFVMPVDVPKSIIQGDWRARPVGDFGGAFSEVFRTRGLSGLFSGSFPALVRSFPANAALFLGYELTRRGLKDI